MLDITSAPYFKYDLAPLATKDPTECNDCSARSIKREGGTLLCAPQDKIEITFDDEGNAAITQSCWPDEDQTILISRDNIDDFIDRLTDALGIPTFGGPAR
jgi:hypothetical protein